MPNALSSAAAVGGRLRRIVRQDGKAARRKVSLDGDLLPILFLNSVDVDPIGPVPDNSRDKDVNAQCAPKANRVLGEQMDHFGFTS